MVLLTLKYFFDSSKVIYWALLINLFLFCSSAAFVAYTNFISDTTPIVVGSTCDLSVSMDDELGNITTKFPTIVTYKKYPLWKILGFENTYQEQVVSKIVANEETTRADWPGWPGYLDPAVISLNLALDSRKTTFVNLGHLGLSADNNKIKEVSFYTRHIDSQDNLISELRALLGKLADLGFEYRGDLEKDWQHNILYEILKPDHKSKITPISSPLKSNKYEVQIILNLRPRSYPNIKNNPPIDKNSVGGFFDVLIRESNPEFSPKEITAKLVDFGIYKQSRTRNIKNENVAGGLVESFNKTLIKETNQIEAKIGTNFGFRYILDGPSAIYHSPIGLHHRHAAKGKGIANVTIKVQHPTPIVDPETGKQFATSEWSQEVLVSPESINWNTGWIFDNDWEIVEGKWVIQLFLEDRMLIERDFYITKAKESAGQIPESFQTPEESPPLIIDDVWPSRPSKQ